MIRSDYEVVFQPRKVQRSGLREAVGGRVLIHVQKEQMLDAVQRHHPARHYVMVGDKLRVLRVIKAVMRERVTTFFPRQGDYAFDPFDILNYPRPTSRLTTSPTRWHETPKATLE